MKYPHEIYTKRDIDRFIESVFEVAYGESAIYKNYTMDEVIEKLIEFSDDALKRREK
jgi:hypothetical protein